MDEEHEDELRANQDGRVYPVGRVLRSTFDADNHDTLGSDVTGLMIDLSKVPYAPAIHPATVPAPTLAPPPPRSWRERLGELLSIRRLA